LAFFVVSFIFVYRSFFGMRIKGAQAEQESVAVSQEIRS
jgi:hypothetical protein